MIIVDARRHVKDGFLKTRIKWMVIKRLFLLVVSQNGSMIGIKTSGKTNP